MAFIGLSCRFRYPGAFGRHHMPDSSQVAADSGSSTSTWLQIDRVFWIAVALVFVVTIIGAWVRRRRHDRTLRLFEGTPVTLLTATGEAVHGRLQVESQGIEIVY